MQFYVVVSRTPEGDKALVGRVVEFDGDAWRSEIYYHWDDAVEMREDMQHRWPEMYYFVKEVNV